MKKVPRRRAVSSAGWAGWDADTSSRPRYPGGRLAGRGKNLGPGGRRSLRGEPRGTPRTKPLRPLWGNCGRLPDPRDKACFPGTPPPSPALGRRPRNAIAIRVAPFS